MTTPFESTEKAGMRERCVIAVDQAGHQSVEDLERLELPDSGLKARLKGDLQSLDDAGVRYFYYVRPLIEDAPPKWLVNFGLHVRKLANVKLNLVYEQVSPELEKACAAAGLGVLVLEADDTFRVVVDFDSVMPADLASDVVDRIDAIRREMERKLEMGQSALNARTQQVTELTQSMSSKKKEGYLLQIELEFRAWDDWSVAMSKKLDALRMKPEADAIERVAREVSDGPTIPVAGQ
ncbi:MAG: hypothetical protein KDB63_22885 [Nocardioidaceae bacterium]|nr:hypothetical protein [Nocardioidaceae bacterium]